ncbi:MAG: hypothetical protein QW561_01275 [Candidatus Aenigmatarchaeota archaeon]
MIYCLWIWSKKTREPVIYEESCLPFLSMKNLHHMERNFVEEKLGLCRDCSWNKTYVGVFVKEHTEMMLCPILFYDALNKIGLTPAWKLDDIAD